mmetsp:Transcript_22772/g.72993  ORF Transcript_22772/g.72993 Transcript_22772/m.72993 type:complete len:146 (-) Transcript_22772:186-623(-)
MTTNSSAVEARSGAARILVGRLCARDGRGRSVRSELAAEAAPRAPFPLAAVGQEAPQAMARRMSTRAGMRSGEQLTSEDAFEATAGEKAEDAAEATPDEKAEDAEATADEKAEATAVGLGTADAQWPKAGMQTRSSHRKAPSAFV